MKKVLYLLANLSDADVEWLISCGTRKRVAAGTVLIREGEPIDALYVVLDGILDVTFSGGSPQKIELGCGDVVGEMSFVEDTAPSATVTSISPVVVLAVTRHILTDKLHADDKFAARFYRSIAVFLSQRLRNTVRSLGYGKAGTLGQQLDSDELDPGLLNSLHLAGSRFDRVLRRLLTE